jgi:uncharacterized protein DUF488
MVGVQPLLCMIKGTASHADNSRGIVFTIGHSTRPLSEFMHLLRDAQIEVLVDVRAVPRSRTNPQFNTDALPETLAAAGIGYAIAARQRALHPMRCGKMHLSETMLITLALKPSEWD